MDRLNQIITGQRELQEKLGYEFESMTTDDRVRYIRDMYVAATKELGEVLDETSWKPWTTREPEVAADRVFAECIDVFQFVLNMIFAAFPNTSPETLAGEFYARYWRKNVINHERIESNYDGVSGKCNQCGRALDEVSLTEIKDSLGYGQFCPCGNRVFTLERPAA